MHQTLHPSSTTVLLLLTALCCGAPTGPAIAEADGPDYFRVVGVGSNDKLNVRSAGSASANAIGQIPPDANGLRNLGCRGGLSFAEWQKASPAQREAAKHTRWCQVEWRGLRGWVAGRFLGEGSAP